MFSIWGGGVRLVACGGRGFDAIAGVIAMAVRHGRFLASRVESF